MLKAIGRRGRTVSRSSVTGMDEFDIADFSTEMDDAQELLALGMDSPTLKKEIFKKSGAEVSERFAAGD